MPIVNYVREIERFIEYASDERLTANERCLWYGLMHIFNQRANGNEWPGYFIPITNERLFTYCPGGFDTLARARNKLKQKKLIDFAPGNRNQAAPKYRMIYFCPESCPENTDKTGFYPQNTDIMRDNMMDNTGDNIRGNTMDNVRDIYTNINRERYTIPERIIDEEEDEEEDSRADAGVRGEDLLPDRAERETAITVAFRRFLGRKPYPAELNRLAWAGHNMKMAPAMIARAVEIAATEGAAKPVAYVLSILDDWKAAHVLQPHQIDRYRLEESIRLGKGPLFSGTDDAAEDWKIREAAAEERKRENIEAGLETDWKSAKEG